MCRLLQHATKNGSSKALLELDAGARAVQTALTDTEVKRSCFQDSRSREWQRYAENMLQHIEEAFMTFSRASVGIFLCVLCLHAQSQSQLQSESAFLESAAGIRVEVFESSQVVVHAQVLPMKYSKARGLPIQVLVNAKDATLLLPGGIDARSALVKLQVRCLGPVWAAEQLIAFDGPGGTGAMKVSGLAPEGQLTWNVTSTAEKRKSSMLMQWLEAAAAKVCISQTVQVS